MKAVEKNIRPVGRAAPVRPSIISMRQSEEIKEGRLREVFTKYPLAYHWFHLVVSRPKHRNLRAHLSGLKSLRPLRVLDLGCGPGQDAGLFDDRERFIYLGVDINPRYISTARRLYRLDFLQADATALTVGERGYDIVLINSLMHHLDDGQLRALLGTAREALSESGECLNYGHGLSCEEKVRQPHQSHTDWLGSWPPLPHGVRSGSPYQRAFPRRVKAPLRHQTRRSPALGHAPLRVQTAKLASEASSWFGEAVWPASLPEPALNLIRFGGRRTRESGACTLWAARLLVWSWPRSSAWVLICRPRCNVHPGRRRNL